MTRTQQIDAAVRRSGVIEAMSESERRYLLAGFAEEDGARIDDNFTRAIRHEFAKGEG